MKHENTIKTSLVVVSLVALTLIAIIGKIAFWEFLFQLILIIASITLALWYVDLGQPRLIFEIPGPQKVYIGNLETVFLKVIVLNRPLRNIPFISRNTAFSCHGVVEFFDLGNTLIFKMPIRWSNNPQPIRHDMDQGKIVTLIDPSLIRSSMYIDIPADEREALDICCRAPNENIAIGWNSDSYWKTEGRFPDRMLPIGDYLVQVTIQYSAGTFQTQLLLHNSESISEMRLQIASQ